jgi:predicted Fe-S protein YdhL (DUF1289 family)
MSINQEAPIIERSSHPGQNHCAGCDRSDQPVIQLRLRTSYQTRQVVSYCRLCFKKLIIEALKIELELP